MLNPAPVTSTFSVSVAHSGPGQETRGTPDAPEDTGRARGNETPNSARAERNEAPRSQSVYQPGSKSAPERTTSEGRMADAGRPTTEGRMVEAELLSSADENSDEGLSIQEMTEYADDTGGDESKVIELYRDAQTAASVGDAEGPDVLEKPPLTTTQGVAEPSELQQMVSAPPPGLDGVGGNETKLDMVV